MSKYEVPVFRKLKPEPVPTRLQQELIPPLVDLPSDAAVDAGLTQQVKLRRAELKRLAFERKRIDDQVKALLGEIAELYKIKRRRAERRYYPTRKARGHNNPKTPGEHQP